MRYILMWCVLLGVGCSLRPPPSPDTFPTATTIRSAPSTLAPVASRAVSVVNTVAPTKPSPTQTPTCEAPARPQHHVAATVAYADRRLDVEQRVIVPNPANTPLQTLLFNVEPNRWLETFTLQSLQVAGRPTTFTLTGRRLEVQLVTPLPPACAVEVELVFVLDLPPIIGGPESFRGYFGETPRQINLGHWLPTLAPYEAGQWVHHPALLIGEQVVLAPADWHVTFNLLDAPAGTLVAAPGQVLAAGPDEWQFEHEGGREFAASISGVFRTTSRVTESGYTVEVYTMPDAIVPVDDGWADGGAFAAEITAESLEQYANLFGPYIHDRMVVVQGDFPDGMEFSGFAFVSTDWFTAYEGDPAGYLMLITVHEVAHQWWYDEVGNNQALEPWLDEALSTYSEFIYIEEYYPDLVDWWWWFRVNRLNPQGNVDSAVYDFTQIRPYINAVYLRGVLMFHEMRLTLGDEAFYSWLRTYATQNSGELADANDLWAALSPEAFELTAFTRTNFLRHPGVQRGD